MPPFALGGRSQMCLVFSSLGRLTGLSKGETCRTLVRPVRGARPGRARAVCCGGVVLRCQRERGERQRQPEPLPPTAARASRDLGVGGCLALRATCASCARWSAATRSSLEVASPGVRSELLLRRLGERREPQPRSDACESVIHSSTSWPWTVVENIDGSLKGGMTWVRTTSSRRGLQVAPLARDGQTSTRVISWARMSFSRDANR